MYWNEQEIKPKIIEYQNTIDEDERNKIYTNHIHEPLMKLIKAQINTHKFNRFEDFDVLISVALENAYKSLNKYNANHWVDNKNRYARTFDYLSLVVKQSMYYYTKKNELKRRNKNIGDFYNINSEEEENRSLHWEYFCRFADKYFDAYFIGKHKNNHYYEIWSYLRNLDYEYVDLNNRGFFAMLRKVFPDYNNSSFRGIKYFIGDLQYHYLYNKMPKERLKENRNVKNALNKNNT